MINRAKLQHILEYAKQQRHIGMHCKVPPEDMVEIVEMAMLQGADGKYPVIPDDWKLVPVDPTLEMVKAGANAASTGMLIPGMYRVMLAAAPQQDEGKTKR